MGKKGGAGGAPGAYWDAPIFGVTCRLKGRGLWSTGGNRTPCLMEGGKGAKPRAVHIQIRPDPLAKWAGKETERSAQPSYERRYAAPIILPARW
jgi:hypothetical protein